MNEIQKLGKYYEEHIRQDRDNRFAAFDNLPTAIKDGLLEAYGSKAGLSLAIKTLPLNMIVQNLALKLFMDNKEGNSTLAHVVRVWMLSHGWGSE